MADTWKDSIGQIIFLLAVGLVALIPIFIPEISGPFAQFVKDYISQFGVWGPVAMIVLMILATIVSPIPNTLVTLAIGATYGPVWGFIIAMIGSMLASALAFFLSRRFGEKLVERFFPKTHVLHKFITNNAFVTIFVLRIIPSMSFDLISYGVGLTAVSFRTFIVATFFGIIPGILSIVLVGSGLTYDNNLGIIGVAMYAVLIVFGVVLGHRMHLFDTNKKE